MKLIAQCELCKLVHHVDIELEGKTIKCRQCSVPVKVPDLLGSSPELTPPPAAQPSPIKKSRSSRRARGKPPRPPSGKAEPVGDEPRAPRPPTDSEIERRVDSAFLDLVDTLASGRREPSQPVEAGIPSLEEEAPEAPTWGAPQAPRPAAKAPSKSRLGRRKPRPASRAKGLRKSAARRPGIKTDSEASKKRGGASDFKKVKEGMGKLEVLEIMGEPEGVHPQDEKRMTISYPAPDRPGSRKRGQLFTIAFLGDRVIAKSKMSRADAEAFFNS